MFKSKGAGHEAKRDISGGEASGLTKILPQIYIRTAKLLENMREAAAPGSKATHSTMYIQIARAVWNNNAHILLDTHKHRPFWQNCEHKSRIE
jgi:hypothetical protein